MICAIYSTICGSYKSNSAVDLIKAGFKPITRSLKLFQDHLAGFKPITRSLKLFQDHLLSSAEAFQSVLKKISCKDDFFRTIVHNSDLEFMVAVLNKVVDKEFVLRRNDLNTLSYELNRLVRKGLEDLTEKIYKMNEEFYK